MNVIFAQCYFCLAKEKFFIDLKHFHFQLFYAHCLSGDLLTEDEINQMFPNLKEILNLHRELNEAFASVKKRDGHVVSAIGDTLLTRVCIMQSLLNFALRSIQCCVGKSVVEAIKMELIIWINYVLFQKLPRFYVPFWLSHILVYFMSKLIGAGSGGARGQLPPWRYFVPPWATFAPPETCILGHFWDKKPFLIRQKPFYF